VVWVNDSFRGVVYLGNMRRAGHVRGRSPRWIKDVGKAVDKDGAGSCRNRGWHRGSHGGGGGHKCSLVLRTR
jgi:hypothetical protein